LAAEAHWRFNKEEKKSLIFATWGDTGPDGKVRISDGDHR